MQNLLVGRINTQFIWTFSRDFLRFLNNGAETFILEKALLCSLTRRATCDERLAVAIHFLAFFLSLLFVAGL